MEKPLLKVFLLTALFLLYSTNIAKSANDLSTFTNYFLSPIVSDDYILFISTNQAKVIKILLENKEWKPINMSYDEKSKLWYYQLEENLKKGKYRYKLMIDDIITTDPLNPNLEPDGIGGFFSVFELKNDLEIIKSNPRKLSKSIYEFRYKDLNATKVILCGSFNNWNPYELEMKREEGGIWKIKIHLPKGKHYYYFIVDDEITPDPLNNKSLKDKNGYTVSLVEVN
ncbi:MAG: hypothetical protein ACP5PT_03675 [Brevinematia bacterium]